MSWLELVNILLFFGMLLPVFINFKIFYLKIFYTLNLIIILIYYLIVHQVYFAIYLIYFFVILFNIFLIYFLDTKILFSISIFVFMINLFLNFFKIYNFSNYLSSVPFILLLVFLVKGIANVEKK